MIKDIAIAILMGGEGSRIGGGKPQRLLGGRTLLDHALARTEAWSEAVALSVRRLEQVEAQGRALIFDAPEIEGPLAGLASSLRWAREGGKAALLTIPCDMPFLPEDLAERLLTGIGSAGVAVAASGGRLHPVCALWRVEALAQLDTYLATGRRSLKGFAEAVGMVSVEWPDAPDPFFNINGPDDLAAAEARLRV